MLDLVTAARRELASRENVTELLGSDETYTTFIFKRRLYVELEGTGLSAVVLSQRTWQAPNGHNTMEFPSLQVEVYTDPPRNRQGHPRNATGADEEARLVWRALDPIFHIPQKGEIRWGGPSTVDGEPEEYIRVLGSQRLGEIDVTDVPGGDGLVRGLVSYGVVLG